MAASDTQTPQDAADAASMLRIVNQDQAALMELYERFGGQVYGLTLRAPGIHSLPRKQPVIPFSRCTSPSNGTSPVASLAVGC